MWISPADADRALSLGCAVFGPDAVIASHLAEVVRQHAADFLGRLEARALGLDYWLPVVQQLLREGLDLREPEVIRTALDQGDAPDDELFERVLKALASGSPSQRGI